MFFVGNSMNLKLLGLCAALSGLLLAGNAMADGHGKHDDLQKITAMPVSDTVKASGCWIRQMPAPAPSGGFLVFHNSGQQDAVITGLAAPDYGMVMMHETTEKDGMSRMSMVDTVVLPAGASFEFKPGGHHLMLEKGRAGMQPGDHAKVHFALQDGSSVVTDCELKSPKDMPAMADHDHSHH